MVEVAGPWLARALADGSYRHWLALHGVSNLILPKYKSTTSLCLSCHRFPN